MQVKEGLAVKNSCTKQCKEVDCAIKASIFSKIWRMLQALIAKTTRNDRIKLSLKYLCNKIMLCKW